MSSKRGSAQACASLLAEIQDQIEGSRTDAASALNRQVDRLYRRMGKVITEQQEIHGWGESVAERLSCDLQRAFPGIRGFSATNLDYMRRFCISYRQAGNFPAASGKTGVAAVRLTSTLPDELKGNLPTSDELEQGLNLP